MTKKNDENLSSFTLHDHKMFADLIRIKFKSRDEWEEDDTYGETHMWETFSRPNFDIREPSSLAKIINMRTENPKELKI